MPCPGERNVRRRLFLALLLALVLLAALVFAVHNPAVASPADMLAAQQPEGRPGQPIIIRWSTETERNTAGFNVYRALSQDGPWEKINQRLIPGSPDPLRGGSYVFTDTNVIAGIAYWYELEEVELGGRATRLERITATTKGQGLWPLSGLQCTSGLSLLLIFSLGIVVISRRKGTYELS
jgi:hypothetical protein